MASPLAAPSDHATPRARLLLVANRLEDLTFSWLCEGGYAVEIVGIGEALWGWPWDRFDLVLVDATGQPLSAIELCAHIKRECPNQRVAMIVGNRSGPVPFRFPADAVLSGEPTGPFMIGAINLLLSDTAHPKPEIAEAKKPAASVQIG